MEKLNKYITAILISAVLCVVLAALNIPNPILLLMTLNTAIIVIGGYGPGIIAAIITLLFALYYYSIDHTLISFTILNLQKVITTCITLIINLLVVGKLKKKSEELVKSIKLQNESLEKENLDLEFKSTYDALTHIKNRYGLRNDFDKYTKHHLCISLIDVDDFKSFNDNYGHDIGDAVLKTLALEMKTFFDENECYRYGGDEFLIMDSINTPEQFVSKMNKMRDHLHNMQIENLNLSIHISVGYVYGIPEDTEVIRKMFKQVDNFLYEVKREGKDDILGDTYHETFVDMKDFS